ncbi:MAG TPA: SHOCT domain-containing protein [Actinomycetota bacterium]|jgi:Phospholipase_D-nuclease N-terminal/Short C-terminal domain|nr:SHOCT domain-containing protein [Actinomycetota bacterium]
MEWTFGDFLWSMIVFYFWFLFIWAFIRVFADIFRRNDLSGGAKAGWVILIVVLPFLGIVIYLVARPRMTEQDREILMEAEARQHRMAGYSAAEEIDKLARLRDQGQLTAEEYETLKRKAMA